MTRINQLVKYYYTTVNWNPVFKSLLVQLKKKDSADFICSVTLPVQFSFTKPDKELELIHQEMYVAQHEQ